MTDAEPRPVDLDAIRIALKAYGIATEDGPMADLFAEFRSARSALRNIVNLLGPDLICDCPEEGCEGLRFEAAESLRIARIALSGARR